MMMKKGNRKRRTNGEPQFGRGQERVFMDGMTGNEKEMEKMERTPNHRTIYIKVREGRKDGSKKGRDKEKLGENHNHTKESK